MWTSTSGALTRPWPPAKRQARPCTTRVVRSDSFRQALFLAGGGGSALGLARGLANAPVSRNATFHACPLRKPAMGLPQLRTAKVVVLLQRLYLLLPSISGATYARGQMGACPQLLRRDSSLRKGGTHRRALSCAIPHLPRPTKSPDALNCELHDQPYRNCA